MRHPVMQSLRETAISLHLRQCTDRAGDIGGNFVRLPASPKCHHLEDKPIHLTAQHRVWRRPFAFYTRWLSEVERVVPSASPNTCGFAAGYLRLRRLKWHRLEDKPIHLRSCWFRFGQRSPSKSQRRQNKPAHFAETDAVTIAL